MELEKKWGEHISEGGNKFTSIGVFPWGKKFTGKYVPGRTYFGGTNLLVQENWSK